MVDDLNHEVDHGGGGDPEERGGASAVPDQARRVDGPGAPEQLAGELRQMWERLDPVPAGLAERAVFALEVGSFGPDDLDTELELMRLQQSDLAGAGARGDDAVRTVTFGSESMTVMLAISDVDGGHRIDGWVAPGGRRGIEVRTAGGSSREECDETGRFALAFVPPGHFQLVLVGEGTGEAARAVVTPALTL
ncbi:hypothetical protein [Jannaschia sp. R86511]|uniref:hypothetical protein n=1 Tax=Jannaschia sp. R86511 TaxID=3093853 RepID=UPI0036D2C74B